MPTTKSTPFMVSEDEWEGPGKSMRNILYVLYCGVSKGTSRDKAM